MRRALGLIAAVAVLVTCLLSGTALAAGNCKLAVTVGEVAQGKVSATVSIKENPGIASLTFSLKFDNTKLTLISASAVKTTLGTAVTLNTDQPGLDLSTLNEVGFSWYDTNAVNGIGALITLEFKLKDGAWSNADLALAEVEAMDGNMTGLTTSTSNAGVNNPVPSHTHTPDAAWQSDDNQHWHKCTDVGCTEKLDAATHTFDQSSMKIITPATETTHGEFTATCKVCGYVKSGQLHNGYIEDWVYDETQHWHVCTVPGCGYKMGVEAHNWDKGVVTQQPTNSQTGIKTFTCTDCGYQKTESIPATGGQGGIGLERPDRTETTQQQPPEVIAPQPPTTGDQEGILALCLLIAGVSLFILSSKKANNGR